MRLVGKLSKLEAICKKKKIHIFKIGYIIFKAWHYTIKLLCSLCNFNQSCKISAKIHIMVNCENYPNGTLLDWEKLCSLFMQSSSINYLKGMNSESMSRLDLSLKVNAHTSTCLLSISTLKAFTGATNSRSTEPTNHLLTIQIIFISCSHLFLVRTYAWNLGVTSSSSHCFCQPSQHLIRSHLSDFTTTEHAEFSGPGIKPVPQL